MSKRIEVLEKVKKQIEEKGTIRFKYTNGSCMCAVGYVLEACGVSMTEFEEYSEMNGDPISRVANSNMDIFDSIANSGLSVGNLITLQKANDDNHNSDDRKDAVMDVINELIEDFKEADAEKYL